MDGRNKTTRSRASLSLLLGRSVGRSGKSREDLTFTWRNRRRFPVKDVDGSRELHWAGTGNAGAACGSSAPGLNL